MLPPITVSHKEGTYNISIGQRVLENIGPVLKALKIGKNAVVITNPVIEEHHGKALAKGLRRGRLSFSFISVPAGERSKSARMAVKLIEGIAADDAGKETFVIAFGGGVIGDLAGYVAAAYKRGIPYVQVPTTFLAQIDSAIGGKVGVDLPVGKNLLGAFYQPCLVFSDVEVLSTLSKRQIRNGLAEAVKYGVICDRTLFVYLEKNAGRLLALDSKTLQEVVQACSRIKARVVMSDEKETKGIRTILNFGHTAGHAIEAANRFKNYHHGEAVALGMRVAAEISRRMRLLSSADAQRINQLLSACGLPEKIRHVTTRQILKHMQHDKKFKGKKNRFVLATGLGSVKVVEGVNWKTVRAALETYR